VTPPFCCDGDNFWIDSCAIDSVVWDMTGDAWIVPVSHAKQWDTDTAKAVAATVL